MCKWNEQRDGVFIVFVSRFLRVIIIPSNKD